MHAHGIEILDGADDDHVIGAVAHHLQLELFPADDGFFDEDRADGAEFESAGNELVEFFAVVGDAAAAAAEGEAGPQDARQADLLADGLRFREAVDQTALRHIEADLDHGVFEQHPVFRHLDGLELRANQFDVVFFENAAIGEFHCQVERSLSAHRGQQGEFALLALHHLRFLADDLFEIGLGERLDVGAVGHLWVGHDGGRIGIAQHHLIAFALECLAGLRAGVIELSRLANHNRPGADDQDLRDVISAGH